MAALHLVEQGKLSLDADLSQVLTFWKNSRERARRRAPDQSNKR
jgi:CubicO group peptidase (beta-lactamase class C family)